MGVLPTLPSHLGSEEALPRISRYGRRIPGSLPPYSDAVLSIGHSERPMHLPIPLSAGDHPCVRPCASGSAALARFAAPSREQTVQLRREAIRLPAGS